MGPIINESINATPIWNPTKAFAFALFSSETESAKKAISTADIAPPPWRALPIITKSILDELAAIMLPTKKINKPIIRSGFRPYLSDKYPNGI